MFQNFDDAIDFSQSAGRVARLRQIMADGGIDGFVVPRADEHQGEYIAPSAARSFVQRAEQVLEAGRPSCPFCGNPIDPDGHLCVRANGFRRRDPQAP